MSLYYLPFYKNTMHTHCCICYHVYANVHIIFLHMHIWLNSKSAIECYTIKTFKYKDNHACHHMLIYMQSNNVITHANGLVVTWAYVIIYVHDMWPHAHEHMWSYIYMKCDHKHTKICDHTCTCTWAYVIIYAHDMW